MITQSVIRGLLDRHGPQLEEFIQLFHRWNQKINLSAARSVEEIREHVRDSIHVVPFLEGAARVLDVGSGGGFPVVVAAVCVPSTSFVSLEPVHKKHAFLRTAARELGLDLEARAERLEDHEGRGYDVAMSRATFELSNWLVKGSSFAKIVIGFEGEVRGDITDVERHPYAFGSKQRALLVRRST